MATLKLDHLLSTSTSSTSNASTNSSTNPFTNSFSSFVKRFPAEIRNTIYGFSFPTNITIYPAFNNGRKKRIKPTLPLARTCNENGIKTALSLARTCREIRAEVIPMYFASNMFSFSLGGQVYRFVVSIGKEGRRALRQLEFAWDFSDPKGHLLMLRNCINLQKLHIGLDYGMMEKVRVINVNKSKNKKINIWEQIRELLRQLPRDLEWKIREADSPWSRDSQISTVFEGPGRGGVVEEHEAELRESLRRLRKRAHRAAVEGQVKRRRARKV